MAIDDLDFLRGRKMVLCLPGTELLRQALRERGVPTVDVAVTHVTLLLARRHAFDGAVVDLSAFGGAMTPSLAAALDEALMPGALLLLRGHVAGDLPVASFSTVQARSGPGEVLQKERPGLPVSPGLIVSPYADLLVGCRRVAELGAGRGVFLDALALREIPCLGLDADQDLAFAAVARGHAVRHGASAAITEIVRGCDGVFVGHSGEVLTTAELHALCQALWACLPGRARIVVRGERERMRALRAVIDRRQWASAGFSEVPHDARDLVAVLLTSDDSGPPVPFPEVALTARGTPIEAPLRDAFDVERFERRVHSQGGEDGVLEALFGLLGTTNRCYVEFGCGDGVQCNTAALRRRGWHGLLMDGVSAPGAPDAVIHAAWITTENIEALFDQHGVPDEPDLMSIDLDGNDYWVWRAIRRRPRVIVAEYNANLAADRALTIPYDPQHRWDGTDYYGASLLALVQLGREKGYTLVYCTQAGVNAVFVRDDVLGLPPVDPAAIWRPPNYWYRGARSAPDLSRAMVPV